MYLESTFIQAAVEETLKSSEEWKIVWSTFLGAASSLTILWVWDRYSRSRDRLERGVKAIVQIEHVTHEILSAADRISLILRHAIARAGAARKQGKWAMEVFTFNDIPRLPANGLLDLMNIDLVNIGFRLNLTVTGLNTDIVSFQSFYEKTVTSTNGTVVDQVPNSAFAQSYRNAVEQMGQIEVGYLGLMNETAEVCATSRVLYKKSTAKFMIARRRRIRHIGKWKDLVDKEKKKLMLEIQESRREETAFEKAMACDLDFWRGAE